MNKLKQYWWVAVIIIVVSLILGGSFYWYEWRPSIIKHDCSWVVIKSDNFLTAEEFIKSKQEGIPIIVPKRRATEEEYRFCIHSKGL